MTEFNVNVNMCIKRTVNEYVVLVPCVVGVFSICKDIHAQIHTHKNTLERYKYINTGLIMIRQIHMASCMLRFHGAPREMPGQ